MTIKQSLIWATKKLKPLERAGHHDTPALDAEILLSFAIKKSKEFLYAHSEKKLTTRQWNQFKKLIACRAKHEPVAYLVGHKKFFGFDFYVDKNVLIPRPETEMLVETIIANIKYPISNSQTIVDVGTGSGAIAVSLAHHLPSAKIFATEISPTALKVAQKNARYHKVTITFLRGNLLEPLIKSIKYKVSSIKYLFVVANLPYLTTRQWRRTQPEIKKYEPRVTLDGGKDGLKYYRQLLQQIKKFQVLSFKFQISCFFEIDPSQTKRVTKIIKYYFPTAKIQIKKDLAGRDRLVIFDINDRMG